MIIILAAPVLAETITYDDFECNGFGCGTGWNNNWTISGSAALTTLSSPQGIYMLRGVGGSIATRNFDNSEYTNNKISFWATASSLESGDYCRYYYYDGTTYTQLLQLADGQDSGVLQFYTYNVTSTNSNAGIRMQTVASTGDYCYIDTITTSGTISMPSLNIIMDAAYPISKTNVKIDLASTQINTNYTIRLYDATNTLFCEKNTISPSIAQTVFSTYCNMPVTTSTNARAVMFETSNPSNNITHYFNIVEYQQDYGQLKIEQVYFSAQVLQGGQTEIFTVITKNPSITINKLYVELLFPDNTTRVLSMEPTINDGEYRALITDTYRVGITGFTIRIESGIYYDEYSNNYIVAGYNVDFVEVVNKVAEVAVCKKVEEVPNTVLEVSGTEYSPGDPATMFVQLKDNYGQPVSNGSCWLDVWYPANTSNIHPYTIQDAPMLKALGDDGVYYYDMIAPEQLGVYMLSAKCSYALNRYEIYAQDDLVNYPVIGINSGTWLGNPLVLNTPHDGLYYRCTGVCQANFTFNTSIYGALTNITAINNYLFVATQSAETITVAYWNGTTFVNLANTLSTSTTASGTNPYGYDEILSNTVPVSAVIGGQVILRITGTSGTYYFNSFGIDVLTASGTIQDLKGSSEMHITNIPNASLSLINTQLPASVWNHTTRNLTYYNMTDTTNYTLISEITNYTGRFNSIDNNLTYISQQVAYVNNTVISINGTLYQKIDAINTSINANIDYTRNNLTARIDLLEATLLSYINNISLNVWTYATRTLTAFGFDNTNYTRIPVDVWTNPYRNLTYTPDMTNYTLINQGVWSYNNRTLTYYEHIDMTNYTLINEGVWTYTTRNLTYYPEQLDLTNYTEVAINVWTYITRNLTYYPPELTAQEVWEYNNRNLTYYQNFSTPQVDLTNYSAINEGVWTYSVRNLTYYEDKTNYTQITDTIPTAVWTYTTRNLTYYPEQMDLTNYSRISNLTAAEVWNYSTRDLTYYQINNISASDVWTYINRTLTYYEVNNITATDVWTYNNRTLTYYPTQQDLTNYTAIWTYPDRNLTYYPPAYVNTTAVAEDTWNYASGRYVDGVLI